MDIPVMSEKEYDQLAKTISAQGSLAQHEHQPDLQQLKLTLTWHDNGFATEAPQLNLSALLLTADNRAQGLDDLITAAHPRDSAGSVQYVEAPQATPYQHQHIILLDLTRVPFDVMKILLIASIHNSASAGQNFGLVRSAQVTLHNEGRGGAYLAHLDLTEDAALSAAIVIGELARQPSRPRDWRYVRSGAGDESGLENLLQDYGLQTTGSAA